MSKKKSRKMDQKLVAAKQKGEIYYISGRYNISVSVVKKVVKEIGRSRVKVYALLREMGYIIKTRTHR